MKNEIFLLVRNYTKLYRKTLAILISKSIIVACQCIISDNLNQMTRIHFSLIVYSVDKKPGYSKLYLIQKVFISYNSSVSPQILDQSKLTVCDT